MRKSILTIAAAMLAIQAAPVLADPPAHAPAHGYRAKQTASLYNDRGWYLEPRRVTRDTEVWRAEDGRYHCRRDNGTIGLIIGAAGGAFIGREIDGGRDRTTGTIVGAAVGALIGREIDRGELRCR
jgi:uncharacterized protein YcfJ